MNDPEISVIMSCYNAARTLEMAIQSILEQTFTNFEFIIINDCSTDGTEQVLERFAARDGRIKLHTNPKNEGLAASLNTGIKLSKARYIARMDADDISMKTRLEKQLQYIIENNNVDILGSAIIQMDHDGKEKGILMLPENHEEIVKRVFRKTMLFHPTLLIRKSVFDQHGSYDPKLRWAEDAALWYRIFDKVRFGNIQEPLLKYRIKKSLSAKQAWLNWTIKHTAIKKRGERLKYFGVLVKDALTLTSKVIKYY